MPEQWKEFIFKVIKQIEVIMEVRHSYQLHVNL